MIEQSIAKQYHILPSRQSDLSYSDWTKMVSGLMDDTPLGRIVQIRGETDRKIISRFTPEQRKIKSDWESFLAKKISKTMDAKSIKVQMANIEKMLANMFGAKGGGTK